MMRATLSGVEPAPNGTMILTVLAGHPCAMAGAARASSRQKVNAMRLSISIPPDDSLASRRRARDRRRRFPDVFCSASTAILAQCGVLPASDRCGRRARRLAHDEAGPADARRDWPSCVIEAQRPATSRLSSPAAAASMRIGQLVEAARSRGSAASAIPHRRATCASERPAVDADRVGEARAVEHVVAR